MKTYDYEGKNNKFAEYIRNIRKINWSIKLLGNQLFPVLYVCNVKLQHINKLKTIRKVLISINEFPKHYQQRVFFVFPLSTKKENKGPELHQHEQDIPPKLIKGPDRNITREAAKRPTAMLKRMLGNLTNSDYCLYVTTNSHSTCLGYKAERLDKNPFLKV